MLARFESEAKISALLGEQSNHIVKVKDYGFMDDKTPFYVMEYLDGYDLDHFMKNLAIEIARFLSFTKQICLGLECAHNGILVNGELATIIHRDIKPSNIFLAKCKDKNLVCKILDFGIAQIHDPQIDKSQQRFMGTPQYCSPEQMAESRLNPTSDIYSLGVLMYEMLTQKTPIYTDNKNYQGWYKAHHENIPKPIPSYIQLPENARNIIMKCLEKSPKDRPQSITEILRIISPLEREYKNGKQGEVNPKSTLSFVEQEKKVSEPLPLQVMYEKSQWPSDKPIQKIVFPTLTESREGTFTSLWSMLETKDVKIFEPQSTFCFNHFLFQLNPHPMILWINVLYQRNHEPKWLPYYLDLKNPTGYQISNNLASKSLYYILLFELAKPEQFDILPASETREDVNVTDLEGDDGGKISEALAKDYLNKKAENQDYTVGIWAVKSQFQGNIYNPKTGKVKFNYNTEDKKDEDYRPFYVLFIGKYQDIANYFDKLKQLDSQIENNDKMFILPTPNNLINPLSLGTFSERKNNSALPENNQLQRVYALVDNQTAVNLKNNNTEPYELLEIVDQSEPQPTISYRISFPKKNQDNYSLSINENNLKAQTKVFTFIKNTSTPNSSQSQSEAENEQVLSKQPQEKTNFQLNSNNLLQQALIIDDFIIDSDKKILDLTTTIDLNSLPNPNIYLFEVDILLDNMASLDWWNDWSFNNRSSNLDGSKTQNLSIFMNKLKSLKLETLQNENQRIVIGRLCFGLHKN